jgi:hypothetical protein
MVMRKPLLIFVTLLTLGIVVTPAMQTGEPVLAAAVAKIRDEGLNRSQVKSTFDMFTDGIGPRLTGSTQHKRAAEWARDTLTKWGLSNARLEPWEFGRGWELESFLVEMVEPRYLPLIGYPQAWTPNTNGEVLAPAVFVAGKTADELAAMNLKGAAVLQSAVVANFIATDRVQPTAAPTDPPPAEPGAGRRGGGRGGGGRGARGAGTTPPALTVNQAMHKAGAAVLLVPSRGMHGTVFVLGQQGRDNPPDQLPKVVLAGEHYNMIARMVQRGTRVTLRVRVQGRLLDQDRNTYNVLAEIPGTDPALRHQVVMLGAHLDSWHTGTGATDNADGSAAAMEAFRILKATGLPLRRTLRLALWSGEEQGLLGARAYIRAHLEGDANKAARDALSVYFNIDPGKGPIYGWFLENNAEVAPIFDAWLAPFKDLGAVRNVRQGVGSTDHVAFNQAGIPGFNPVQDYVDYDVREHHTNADTSERVKEQDLRQNAIILASFVYHAAMRNDPIPSAIRK